MKLNVKQLETIKHLKKLRNITENKEIIDWCETKIKQKRAKKQRAGRRYSIAHYLGIAIYYGYKPNL